MPRRQRIRKPRCACSAYKIDGRCSAQPSCDDFAKPFARVRSFEAGREPPRVEMLGVVETRAAFGRLGYVEFNANRSSIFRRAS